MPTTLNKIVHGLLVALFVVAGLGPTVSGLAGVLPADWLKVAAAIVATCSGLALYVAQSPLFTPFLPVKAPDAVITSAKIEKAKAGIVSTLPVAALCLALALSGCLANGQPKPQTEADIQAAEADLKTALPIACVIGEALDPALMTAVCAVADAADNLLTPPAPVVTASAAQAAALVVAHPATPAVAAKLTAVAVTMKAARHS